MRLISGIIFFCALCVKLLAACEVDAIHQLTRRVQTACFNPLVQAVFELTITHNATMGLTASEVENNLKSLYFQAVFLHHPGGFADLKKVSAALPINDYVRGINAISFAYYSSFSIEVSAKVLALQAQAQAEINDNNKQLQKCAAIFAAAICGAHACEIAEVADNLLQAEFA